MKVHDPQVVAARLADGSWTTETLDAVLREQVAARADAWALIDPPNATDLLGTEPRRLTWAQLNDEVDRTAAVLHEHGVRQGDVACVQLPNTVELVVSLLALWRVGAIAMPVPMQFREYELGLVIPAANAKYAVGGGQVGGRSPLLELLGIRNKLPMLDTVFAWGPKAPDGAVGLQEALAGDPTSYLDYLSALTVDPNDCVTICWTSGTEGRPKGVPRAHCDWLAISWFGVDPAALTADDVLLNPFPLVNMAAFCGLLLPWLRTGATLVQHHPFDLPIFLRQVATERVSYTVAPPALLTMLLHKPEVLAQVDISSLTRIGSGSAPLPPAMVRGWQERYGVGVVNFFGSNEGVALISAPLDVPDPEERARYYPRWDAPDADWSVRGASHIRYKLVDPVTGEEISEPGQPGELHMQGPTVFGGYLPGTAPKEPFDDEGYLITGDVFEIAGDRGQYLRFVDRAKDLIIRGGMNISPAEVEGLLSSHPDVAEVAVVGTPDDVLGERMCAVVVPKDGSQLTLDSLVAHLRERRVATYKFPERIEIVDALPRNPVGKVLKRELRDLVMSRAAEPVAAAGSGQ